jgi:hypothetical protein
MLVWWIIQLHNDSDRMHCFTPQTKQSGTQNNTQLLQQSKNSVCQMAKKLQHLYSRMQKSPTLIMLIWVQQSMETPYVTWCNNSQEDSEDAFCKANFFSMTMQPTHHTEATWVAAVISVGICGPSTLESQIFPTGLSTVWATYAKLLRSPIPQ